MAAFETLARWEKYVPALGNNATLERPFYLRLAAGLTLEEFRGLNERLQHMPPTPAGMAEALKGCVELGAEPLVVGQKTIATVEEYLTLIANQRGGELAMELVGTLTRLNSTEGARELFSARLSGGSRTTPHAPETADAHSGSSTNPFAGMTPAPAPPLLAGAASASGPIASADPASPAAST